MTTIDSARRDTRHRCCTVAHVARASDVLDDSKRAGRVTSKDVSCTSTSGADVMPRVYPESRMRVSCAQSIATFAACAAGHANETRVHEESPSLLFRAGIRLCPSPSRVYQAFVRSFAGRRSAVRGDLLKTAANAYRSLRIAHGMWHR